MTIMVVAAVVFLCVFYAFYVLVREVAPRQVVLHRVKGKTTRVRQEPKWFHRLAALREAAGFNLSFSRWFGLSLLGVFLGLILGAIALQNIFVGLLLAVTCAALPTWWIYFHAVRHREKVAEGLIPAFETFYSEYVMTRNIPKAMELTTRQAPDPAKKEFSRMASELYAGQTIRTVLEAFRTRMHNRWVRLFTVLLLMREEKGSRIESSMLNLIAEQRRRQMETKKERSEMAQVRLVHLILMLSSIVLFIVNLVIRPDSYTFFTASSGGRWVMDGIVASLLVSLLIFMLMNRREVD